MEKYLGYELYDKIEEIIKDGETERKIFLKRVEEIKRDEKQNTYLRTNEEIEEKIKERIEPFWKQLSNKIQVLNICIEKEINTYQEKWKPNEFEQLNLDKLKEIFEFSKFDISDDLLEEITQIIIGSENDNTKMLRTIKQAFGDRKMNKLFKPLKTRGVLLKLLNEEMEEMKKHKMGVQTEENYIEKYHDFLNSVEEIQTKVFKLKTGKD